jgi:hypothetical protein
MADSRRKLAIIAFADVLAAIPGVKRATRTWGQYDNFNEFPVLIVTEAQSNGPVIRHVMDQFEDNYRVTVYGYVLGTDQYPRVDALEDLYADVFTAVMANATLSDTVRDIRCDGQRATDGGLWEQRGVFVQDFIVTFDETYPGP